MKYLISGLIGAILGAAITGFITYSVYEKQMLTVQYSAFVDELDKAFIYQRLLKSESLDPSDKKELKTDLEFSLNKAWAKALVILPDEVFTEIDRTFSREEMDKKSRNRIYFLLRQKLYPNTTVEYDNVMNRCFSIK